MTGITLSPQQPPVVDHRGGDLQVIARAGSGNTESISRRIAALIADDAEPESIVAFTFTDRAAAELKERVVRHVAKRMGAAFRDRLGPMYVRTIYGYCFRRLQDHAPRYGNFDVSTPTVTPASAAANTAPSVSPASALATGSPSATSRRPSTSSAPNSSTSTPSATPLSRPAFAHRTLLELAPDVVGHVDRILYGDVRQAAFKALGLN